MSDFTDHYDGSVVDHEHTYRFFIQLAYVGAMHIANFIVALAIGAVERDWRAAFFVMAVATGLSAWSLVRRTKLPLAILLAIALAILGVGNGGPAA